MQDKTEVLSQTIGS